MEYRLYENITMQVRTVVLECSTAEQKGYEIVNVMRHPHAGGSFAVTAWNAFIDPVAVEAIQADAGIDIGEAIVLSTKNRPKYIGGTMLYIRTKFFFQTISAPSGT